MIRFINILKGSLIRLLLQFLLRISTSTTIIILTADAANSHTS